MNSQEGTNKKGSEISPKEFFDKKRTEDEGEEEENWMEYGENGKMVLPVDDRPWCGRSKCGDKVKET